MLREAENTLDRLKEEEQKERSGRKEDSKHGRLRDHGDRTRDEGRRRERDERDRERIPPRHRDVFGCRDRQRDRNMGRDTDRAGRDRDWETYKEDRRDPRRRQFMKPGSDNSGGNPATSYHPRTREEHSPPRRKRGFLKPGEATDTRREHETSESRREQKRERQMFKRPADNNDDDSDIDAMYERRRAELKTRSRSPPRWKKETATRERKMSSSGNSGLEKVQ